MAFCVSSENPNFPAFKLDQDSPLLPKLRDKIGKKLYEIAGIQTDSAVDYIVVLLCHGSNHNQMEIELEVILGERSGEFVSWLWNFLMKSHDQNYVPMAPSYAKSEVGRSDQDGNGGMENTRGAHVLKDHNQATNDADVLLDGFNTSTNDTNEMEGQTQTIEQAIHRNTGPTGNNYNQASKYRPPSKIVYSGNSSGYKPSWPHLTEHKQMYIFKQTAYRRRNNVYLRKTQFRNLESERPRYGTPVVYNVVGRRSLQRADSVFHENAKARVSVWDRLGTPSSDNRSVTTEDPGFRGNDVLKRKREEDPEEAHIPYKLMLTETADTPSEKLKREIPTSDNSSRTVLPSTNDGFENEISGPELNTTCLTHPAHTSIKKRQFSATGFHSTNNSASLRQKGDGILQETKTLQQLQSSLSMKYNSPESLNCVSSGTKLSEETDTSSEGFQPPESAFVQGANTVSLTKLGQEDVMATPDPSDTRSELVSNESAMKTDLKPAHAQILDMKSRMYQIVEEISKLRAKELEYKASKPDILLNSGASSHPGNNVKSRTVCMKNVMRKADMPVVTSVVPHLLGKTSKSQLSHSNQKVVPKPYVGSLRWQRDKPVTKGLSITTPRQGLEASVIVEQISQLHETAKEEEHKKIPDGEEPMETRKEEEPTEMPEEPTGTPDEEEAEPKKIQEGEFEETLEEQEPKKTQNDDESNEALHAGPKGEESNKTPGEEQFKEIPAEVTPKEAKEKPKETRGEDEFMETLELQEPKKTREEEDT